MAATLILTACSDGETPPPHAVETETAATDAWAESPANAPPQDPATTAAAPLVLPGKDAADQTVEDEAPGNFGKVANKPKRSTPAADTAQP